MSVQVLESSRQQLAAERWADVISDLAPILFSDSAPAARTLFGERKTFLESLQMLQVALAHPLYFKCN